MAALVAASAAGLLGVVIVTGFPIPGRPSLGQLVAIKGAIDERNARAGIEGVSTHLDLLAGEVVIDQTVVSCRPMYSLPTALGPESWAFVRITPERPLCNVDI